MVPAPRQPESLADYLHQHLNLTPEFEAGGLSVEQIADIAMLAIAHSDGYAATSHLVSLMSGLPLPSDEPDNFWTRLWHASGSPIFIAVNISHQVLRALEGDAVGLADQLLTAISDMDAEQRTAACAVIGEALEDNNLGGFPAESLGQWWLKDVETTAWKVLYADRRQDTLAGQQGFRDGWRQA